MGARPGILLAVAVGAAILVATAVVGDDGATHLSDSTAVSGRATTTSARPSPPTSILAPTTTLAPTAGRSAAAAVASESAANGEEPPGLVITNSGVATASVGGNVVSGVPGADPGTAVVTGDATAIGNSSSVRTP